MISISKSWLVSVFSSILASSWSLCCQVDFPFIIFSMLFWGHLKSPLVVIHLPPPTKVSKNKPTQQSPKTVPSDFLLVSRATKWHGLTVPLGTTMPPLAVASAYFSWFLLVCIDLGILFPWHIHHIWYQSKVSPWLGTCPPTFPKHLPQNTSLNTNPSLHQAWVPQAWL